MKLCIYSIYDKTVEEFGNLFEAKNNQVAIRKYIQLMENMPFRDDFKLVKLGEWDNEIGQLEKNGDNPKSLEEIAVTFAPRKED